MDSEPPYVYPSKPDHDPSTPELDGFADVVVGEDWVELRLRGGVRVRIPGITILRDSFKVAPGDDHNVNRLTLTLLAGTMSFGPNVSWTEVVPGKKKIAVDGKAEDVTWPRANV